MPPPVVTFDLFSALLDSRTGGSAVFDVLAAERGWACDGRQVYDAWDRRNKGAQRDCTRWVPYAELARGALTDAYAALGLGVDSGTDPDADVAVLLDSLPDWPLWPDVADVLPLLAAERPVGILSNVDDDLLARTRAAHYVDPGLAVTSQRLRAYKPHPELYTGAQRLLGPMVHVATSARDVRGALEASMPVVRLRRPGHELDADGPRPSYEVGGMAELRTLLAAQAAQPPATP